MEKRLTYSYDKHADELNLSLGDSCESISLEIGDEIYVKMHPKTKEVIGFTILHFEERFRNKRKIESFPLPLTAYFCLRDQDEKILAKTGQ